MTNELIGQLATSALVGVARKSPILPILPGKIGELIASLDNKDASVKLLQIAGILALAEDLAAVPVVVMPNAVVAPAPEETTLPLNSPHLHETINELLEYGPIEILTELLNLLTEHNFNFPFVYLPRLLDLAIAKPSLRDTVANLPGNRQRWLIELNPHWQKLSLTSPKEKTFANLDQTTSDIAVGQTETTALERQTLREQISLLKQIRAKSPMQGRKTLAALLPQANAQERQELLAVLQNSLSLEDVALLDSLLQDRSKGVKQMAANMLSCLPESAFAKRMFARLDAIVTVKIRLSNSKLIIEIPEQIDALWQRDGIEEQPPLGEGAKSFWLRQLTGLTPLIWWKNKFGLTPDKILPLFKRSDWYEPLLLGLCAAAVTQSDAEWAAALLEQMDSQSKLNNIDFLFRIAKPEVAEAILERKLKTSSKISEWFAITQLATNMPQWSISFSNELIAGLREHIDKLGGYSHQLVSIAMCLPAECLIRVATDWENNADKSAINTFLKYIQLRYLIYRELKLLQ